MEFAKFLIGSGYRIIAVRLRGVFTHRARLRQTWNARVRQTRFVRACVSDDTAPGPGVSARRDARKTSPPTILKYFDRERPTL